MILRTWLDSSKIVEKVEGVRFVHAAYRPASMRDEFPFYEVPETEYVADFWLAEGETVESVLKYHYHGAATPITTGQ